MAGKRKVTTISSDIEILSDSIEVDSDFEVFPKISSLSSKERSFLGTIVHVSKFFNNSHY